MLLTSVCRPMGAAYGDAPSVGYELLFAQVTRAQGAFSPRATHVNFGLEYIAENLDCPATVLQYPSKRELIRELKKKPDYVGIAFILVTYHKMKEISALVREHAPEAKIVLGGYGTVMPDDMLAPYGDHICREEGVGYMRRLLGEPEVPMPYKHPLVVSRLRLFSLPVSKTGMIFAGLGCPNGCDFCCTSHFFKRKHIRLLETGRDIYQVIERYLAVDPKMSFTILDEDFLLNRRRAEEFRECVQAGGRPLSIFCFTSLRALSQYTPADLHAMGIDGVWIGYEGTRSGYAKQSGRSAEEVFREFKENGITILASMIVGFEYQDPEVVAEELDGLLGLEPCLSQFLIYGPTPGTPFWDRIQREGRLRPDLQADRTEHARLSDGFTAMVVHPKMSGQEIERLQRWCFRQDYERLGPSIYRVVERWLCGYRKLKDSPSPFLRAKARRFAEEIRKAYPSFAAGRWFGPTPAARAKCAAIERECVSELGRPTLAERAQSLAAAAAAAWTWACLKLDWFQHPRMIRTSYRVPEESWAPAKLWESLPERLRSSGVSLRVRVEQPQKLVWVRLEGALAARNAGEVWRRIQEALADRRQRLVLDLAELKAQEAEVFRTLRATLRAHRRQVRVVLPRLQHCHPELLLLARLFQQYGS